MQTIEVCVCYDLICNATCVDKNRISWH